MPSLLARIALLAIATLWAVQPALCREYCCGPTAAAPSKVKSCCHPPAKPASHDPGQQHPASKHCCCQPATTPTETVRAALDLAGDLVALPLATTIDAVSTQAALAPAPPEFAGPSPRLLQCVWRL